MSWILPRLAQASQQQWSRSCESGNITEKVGASVDQEGDLEDDPQNMGCTGQRTMKSDPTTKRSVKGECE